MTAYHRIISAAVLSALAAAPAVGQTMANDARCLAAMSMAQDQAPKADKGAFDSGMMYFLGKLVGRGGMKSVGPAVEAAAAGLTPQRAPKIADACADELVRAGDAM